MNRELLFRLIRQEICGTELSVKIKKGIDSDTLKALYIISKKFDIAPIVVSAILNSGVALEPEAELLFNKELMVSTFRYENMEYELEAISKVLEEEKIPHIPLKGAVIRELYPEKWMRTSCDVDVLVKEEDIDRAVNALCNSLSYKTDGKKEFHDVSLYSESGIHLELHFNIKENREELDCLLSRAWEFSDPVRENGYKYKLTNEFLIFHNIAHMVHHFLHGGCGVRSFIDLYLMELKLEYNKDVLSELCKESSIETFRIAVEKLSRVWLLGEVYDELSCELEEYILNGGIYGDSEVDLIVNQEKSGGKFKYFINRIFQPYDKLNKRYPRLRGKRYLTPFYQVKRWFDIVAEGKAKKAQNELSDIVNSDKEKKNQIIDIINKVGLNL